MYERCYMYNTIIVNIYSTKYQNLQVFMHELKLDVKMTISQVYGLFRSFWQAWRLIEFLSLDIILGKEVLGANKKHK
jgi:hypothetical protein